MLLTNEYRYIGRSNPLVTAANYEYYLLLYAKTDPDTAMGAHRVSVKMRMAANVNTAFYDWPTTGYARVEGVDAFAWEHKAVPSTNWNSYLTEDGIHYPRWVELKEGTALVTGCFGADKEVTLEASWVLDYNNGESWLPPAGEAVIFSAAVTLPGIDGPTVPVLSAGSVELGKSVTIQTPALMPGARHTLQYRFGGAEGVIAEDVEQACTWTPPMELAMQIPNAPGGRAVILCQTYLQGEKFGAAQETTVQLTVPASVVPTASATWEDASGAFEALGVYAKGVSKLTVDVVGTGVYGSTITGAAVTLGGKAYAGGVIPSAGDLELTVTVRDSRGRSGSQTYPINVSDYAAPTLTLTASRCSPDGAADDMGEYAKITVTGYVSPAGKNTAALKLSYGAASEEASLETGEISYSILIPAPSAATLPISATLSDGLFSAPASMVLSVGYATMDFLRGGKGIAFGTTATEEGFQCAMPARFTGGVSFGGSPVGDFVTEQGQDGSWKYRKWASGTVEAWSEGISLNLGSGTAYAGGYTHSATFALPLGLFGAQPAFGAVNCDIPAAANYVGWKSTAGQITVTLFCPQAYGPDNHTTLSIYLRS